ncbi:hypothetical protein JCGZ_17109 [Jatropha curcas]|uniref:Uncharacterized protein n=1 Tax=Jatropha curcas TaxID=180498 RepID=A0A067KDP9_JATCU|nr:hypothetical protein JCGZ_17109 [Jatropha curcas]
MTQLICPTKCCNGTVSPPRQIFKVPLGTVRRTTSCSGAFSNQSCQLVQSVAEVVNNHHDITHLANKCHNGTISPPRQSQKSPIITMVQFVHLSIVIMAIHINEAAKMVHFIHLSCACHADQASYRAFRDEIGLEKHVRPA